MLTVERTDTVPMQEVLLKKPAGRLLGFWQSAQPKCFLPVVPQKVTILRFGGWKNMRSSQERNTLLQPQSNIRPC